MPKFYAATTSEMSEREKKHMERARAIASQGMVLLENQGALPIAERVKRIALFGNGARHTVKGGTGSGDVNSRFVVNVERGLEEAGLTVTTKDWLDRYDRTLGEAQEAYYAAIRARIADEGEDAIMLLFEEPFEQPPVIPVTDEDIRQSDTDTAVYVLSRNSGEGKDRSVKEGDFLLHEAEKAAIEKLLSGYANVIVVLNVGGVIDTGFLRERVGALLLMSQAGNIGGYALADVLTGKVTPSGHLTTTWAGRYLDYPGADAFSHVNNDTDDEYYREGIYVGYRYFDTFGVSPAYPFGYGLSYTDFRIETVKSWADAERVTVQVKVTNTGSVYAGKAVVQVYYSAPEGRLEKPYQELAAYAKTRELLPGECEVLAISYPTAEMASYDEERASYILEAGNYYVRVGAHSRSTHVAACICLDADAVTSVLSNRAVLDCEMEELSAEGASPYTYGAEQEEKDNAPVILIRAADIAGAVCEYRSENQEITVRAEAGKIKLTDVIAGRASMDKLLAQLTVEEMAQLCVGTARGGHGGDSVIGAASAACPGAAGDTTSCMTADRDIRNMILADGPAGLRLSAYFVTDKNNELIPGASSIPIAGLEHIIDMPEKPVIPEDAIHYYQYCTAIPIATLLAQTWDVDVIADAGDLVGSEMEEFGVALWLAPGMNIHRNPLCGRNFEYYSEDPLVAGMCAAADTRGVQKHPGAGTTIKHFACNNQEDNRMHVNAHVGERALREIYLKGFEIAVKAAQPMSIMTSYNLVNGTHTANSYDLLTAIARKEWGFAGIVMTDWGTTGSTHHTAGKAFRYGDSSAVGCIRAGNDLIMPGSQKDVDEIVEAVGADADNASGATALRDLRACAKRMLSVIAQSLAYGNAKPYAAKGCALKTFIDVKRGESH